jgi:uncharacterized repeat protein (TIGR01451 family)
MRRFSVGLTLSTLLISAVASADLRLTISAAPLIVLTGSTVTYSIQVTNDGEVAIPVTVNDELPPTLALVSCSADPVATCGGFGNYVVVTWPAIPSEGSASVTLVARVLCGVPDGATIANTATETYSTATVSITASDPPPLISAVSVSQSTLWPPNHGMVDVVVNYSVSDHNCDGPPVIGGALSVTSNEPQNGLGDGDTSPDWEIVDATHVRLRAERAGAGSGRIYTITVTATDSAGYSSTSQVTVTVPKNKK